MDTCVVAPYHNTGLPSAGLFDSSKFNRDAAMDQSRRGSSSTTSPTSFRFPAPVNHSQSSQAPSVSSLISPPTSRRTSSEEQAPAPPARQSLPSIAEALQVNRDNLTYTGLPPPPPPPASVPASSAPFMHPPAASAPPEPPRRQYGPPEPSPHRPSGPNHSPHHPPRHSPASTIHHSPTTAYPPQGPPSYSPHAKPPAPPHIKTEIPPHAAARQNSTYPPPHHQPSHSYDSGPHSAPPNPPYGYSGYQSQQHSQPHPQPHPQPHSQPHAQPHYQYPPSSSSSQGYPAPAVLSAAPQYHPPPPGSYRDYAPGPAKPQANHKDNIKRKLDEFQLGQTTFEIRELGQELQSFAEQCQRRMFDAQSTGFYQSVANVLDIDHLSQRMRQMQDQMGQLRDLVSQPNDIGGHDGKSILPIPNGYMRHDGNGYSDESKQSNMYPPPDTKKRRGRAAPPGRCHSCNRAETPEWRRGPDGARTLCNACGLHYAKLTRKMGNNKNPISNSNLRPKSLGPGGSPPGPPPPGMHPQ